MNRHLAIALVIMAALATPAHAQMWDDMPGGPNYERSCGRCHFWPGRFAEQVFLPGRRAAFYNFLDRHHAEDPVLRLAVMEFVRAFSRKHKLVEE